MILRTFTTALLFLAIQSVQGEEPKAEKKAPEWKSEIFDNLDSFRALFKPNTYGAAASELIQWEGGPPQLSGAGKPDSSSGEERVAQLKKAVENYPNSPFVDDASLLLARASFMYGRSTVPVSATITDPESATRINPRAYFKNSADAESAIDSLYEVIKKYPDGNWIAEDPIVRTEVSLEVLKYYPRRERAAIFNDESEKKIAGYMQYITEHPNKTADEAKVCIAWIIFKTRNEKRYSEAEQLLRSIIEHYRESGRTQADQKAADDLNNDLIKRVPRTERSASGQLIALLRVQEKEDAAINAVDEYARLFKGHPSVANLIKSMEQPRDSKKSETNPKRQ